MKFRLGDMVRVKANSKFQGGRYAGMEGKVVAVHSTSHPYVTQLGAGGQLPFHGNELEKV